MTEDDTLLVLAAGKAAGLDVGVIHQRPHRRCDAGWTPWNPLESDGDALRLAVALGLLVYVMRDAGFTGIRLPGEHIGGKYDEVEMHGTDPCAATRRAIVRAAAAIADAAAE